MRRGRRTATSSPAAAAGDRRSAFGRRPGSYLRLPGEIRDLGQRAEIAEQLLAARRARQPRDLAVGIVEIAEHQRTGRTRLRARGGDVAVLHLALRGLRVDR